MAAAAAAKQGRAKAWLHSIGRTKVAARQQRRQRRSVRPRIMPRQQRRSARWQSGGRRGQYEPSCKQQNHNSESSTVVAASS